MGKRELGCFGHGGNSCRRSAESDLARILRSSEWGVKVGQGGGDEDEVDRSAMPRGLQVAGRPALLPESAGYGARSCTTAARTRPGWRSCARTSC
jgi:hypothetical protein